MNALLLLGGLVVLIYGGDLLVKGALALSFRLKISPLIVGLTVVSFATSAPELLVSLQAALKGHTDITFGNVIGSNIANIGLVLGATALFFGLPIEKQSIRFDWPAVILSYLLLSVCIFWDGELGLIDGLIFLVALCLFILILIQKNKRDKQSKALTELETEKNKPLSFAFFFLAAGGLALYFGSDWLVQGATGLAHYLGISDRVISLSMIAIGTSLPELAASLMAAYRKESGISIGNLLGSNIFNVLAVLGCTASVHPLSLDDPQLLGVDFPWMWGFALVLLPLMLLPGLKIRRWAGLLLLVGYITYMTFLF